MISPNQLVLLFRSNFELFCKCLKTLKLFSAQNIKELLLYSWTNLYCLGDEWVHENHDIEPPLTPGDVVYYWFLVIHNGEGQQMTDLSWTVVSGRYHIQHHLYLQK